MNYSRVELVDLHKDSLLRIPGKFGSLEKIWKLVKDVRDKNNDVLDEDGVTVMTEGFKSVMSVGCYTTERAANAALNNVLGVNV